MPENGTVAILKETHEIVEQIGGLAVNIYNYQQQLITLSFKDELTGLHNRRTLFKEYENYQAMIKRGSTCTLLLFDLDNFKACNDNFGHNFGDEVLQTFAKILQNNIRDYDSCARLGGDEFIAILPNCSHQEIESRYKQISNELLIQNRIWQKNYQTLLPISVSSGALIITNYAMNIEQVIEYADKALYNAKNGGRAKISFYTDKLE